MEEVHRAVLTEDNKRAAHRALQDRILHGEGRASPEQRARAFSNAGLSEPLDGLLGKVATRPTQVTDADFAAARAAGFSRLADAFGFEMLSPEGFEAGAKYLLKRGYR